jgi:hypothetical protein
MNNEFAGWLMTFEKKDDSELEDKGVLLEVTQVKADGTVEIAFDDRNERCYLKFDLSDLMKHICLQSGEKE